MVSVPGSAAVLSKAQKRFNKLVADIQAQRQSLRLWTECADACQRRIASEFTPLHDQLHERRVDMVKLLDRALDHPSLGKTHRAKVSDMLQNMLAELVVESDDPELVRLHDKHSELSLEEIKAEDLDFTQAMASELFGVELDDEQAAAATPEELAERIHQKVQAQAEEQAQKAQASKRARKKSPKTLALEAQREQAAKAASQSLREVYRKLVSELHPDREPDAVRREHKTALMKRVNQAYEAADLLALLELQLEVEQIDAQALAGMNEDRVIHFNAVLAEQLKQLQAEIAEVRMSFPMTLGGPGHRFMTPAAVRQALEEDLADLQMTLQQLQEDLQRFEDIKQLKSSLRHYRIEPDDDDGDLAMLDFLLMGGQGMAHR